jgi:hypothetical protein
VSADSRPRVRELADELWRVAQWGISRVVDQPTVPLTQLRRLARERGYASASDPKWLGDLITDAKLKLSGKPNGIGNSWGNIVELMYFPKPNELDPDDGPRHYDQVHGLLTRKVRPAPNAQPRAERTVRRAYGDARLKLARAILELPDRPAFPPAPSSTVDGWVDRPEAQEALLAALASDRRVIWVTGEVGTGKSMVVDFALRMSPSLRALPRVTAGSERFLRDSLSKLLVDIARLRLPDNLSLLTQEAIALFRAESRRDWVVVIDDVNDLDLVDTLLRAAETLAVRVVFVSWLPVPPHLLSVAVPVVVGDMRRDQSVQLVGNILGGGVGAEDQFRLAAVLRGRPLAIELACNYIKAFDKVDVAALCRDLARLDRDPSQLRLIESAGVRALSGVYAELLRKADSDGHALWLLELMAFTPSTTPMPLSVIRSAWAWRHGVPPETGHDRAEEARRVYAERGEPMIHLSIVRPVLRQWDEMAIDRAIKTLARLGLIERTDDSLTARPFAMYVIRLLRGDRAATVITELRAALFAEAKRWPWLPGDSVPLILREWLEHCSLLPSDVQEPSDDTYLLLAMSLRALRQRRYFDADLLLPEWLDFDDIPTLPPPNLEQPLEFGAIVYLGEILEGIRSFPNHHVEDDRAASEWLAKIDAVPFPKELRRRIIPSELTRCTSVGNADFLAWYRKLGNSVLNRIDSYSVEREVCDENGIGLAKDLYCCGKVEAAAGNFVRAALLFVRGAAAYRSVGGAPQTVAGELACRVEAVYALLHRGDRSNARHLLEKAQEVKQWHDDVLAVRLPEFTCDDVVVLHSLSDVTAEFNMLVGVSNVVSGSNVVFSRERLLDVIDQLYYFCRNLEERANDHGALVEHAERLGRLLGIAAWCTSEPALDESAVEISQIWRIHRAQSWLHTMRQALVAETACHFGARQIELATRLRNAVAAVLACSEDVEGESSRVRVPFSNFFALPFSYIAEVNREPELAPVYAELQGRYVTVGDSMRDIGSLPSVLAFVGLARKFRQRDRSAYWYGKSMSVAACLQSSDPGRDPRAAWVRREGVRVARQLQRADWLAAIETASRDPGRALLRFCAL